MSVVIDNEILQTDLDIGESETIVLAMELRTDLLLMGFSPQTTLKFHRKTNKYINKQ